VTTQRVERRLAAILAADVANYSRLMGADEEGTLARLKALRRELADPKIKEHRGRIVKTRATASSSSLPASSTQSVARSKCSARWQSETPVCRRMAGSSSGWGSISAM
jgi:class 3 adenylate cyclase